jgi:hypothetical protein
LDPVLTLLGMRRADDEGPTPAPVVPQPDATADILRERYALLLKQHDFKLGDLVEFKPGLDPRNGGLRGQPLLVVDLDVTDYPMAEPSDMGDMTGRLDIALLDHFPRFGVCVLRLYDRRLLQPWTPPAA